MLILAADTSGKLGSISLAKFGPDNACDVLEVVGLEGGTFSAQLVPQIASLLGKYGFNKLDLDAFAVVSGPGSFTGLRVGLAAIKGLGEILGKPVVAVSLLEAIASSAPGLGKIVAVTDAGRGEVYCGEYEVGDAPLMVSESLLTRVEMVANVGDRRVITPDPGIAEFARTSGLTVIEIERPRSDVIARLAVRKLKEKKMTLPETLDANYIRRSDAEIFSAK